MVEFPGSGVTREQRNTVLRKHTEAAMAAILGELSMHGDNVAHVVIRVTLEVPNVRQGPTDHTFEIDYNRGR